MTRPRDLVRLAKGDVRVSPGELDFEDLLNLFNEYVYQLDRHYDAGNKGGSSFVEWNTENFGEELTIHSIRRYALALDETLYPKEKEYGRKTRIVSLTGDYFYMPEFKEPRSGDKDRKLGDEKLVIRLCVTNTGKVFLEWYEGKVIKMYDEHPTLPEKVLVTMAEYIPIPYCYDAKTLHEKLKKLLRKHPTVVLSFGMGILRLIYHEAEERKRREERDRDLFNKLNSFGRIFGITHP